MMSMENAVTGEEIPIVEPKRNQTGGVAGDVKCFEFVLPRFDREAHTTSRVQLRMKVTQGVDHDRLPCACDYVAQASSRWPGYLVESPTRALRPERGSHSTHLRLSSHP